MAWQFTCPRKLQNTAPCEAKKFAGFVRVYESFQGFRVQIHASVSRSIFNDPR
jgi:hypothetical protein